MSRYSPLHGRASTRGRTCRAVARQAKSVKEPLNAALGGTVAIVLVFLLLSRTIGAPLEDTAIEESMEGYTPIAERYLEDYYTEGENSYILENGTMTGPDGASLWLGTHYFVDF